VICWRSPPSTAWVRVTATYQNLFPAVRRQQQPSCNRPRQIPQTAASAFSHLVVVRGLHADASVLAIAVDGLRGGGGVSVASLLPSSSMP